jgi:hypothetical protein
MGRRSLARWAVLPGGERRTTPRRLSHPGAGFGRDAARRMFTSNGAGYAVDRIAIPGAELE